MTAVYHTLEQKLERLKEQLIRLEHIKKEIKHVSDLKTDYAKEALVERFFQIILEAVLDISRIIISVENLPRPETNEEIFLILAKAKVISHPFAQKAKGLGTFRNILVHGYMIIDEKRVFENLQKLSVFHDFVKFIAKYLKEKIERN